MHGWHGSVGLGCDWLKEPKRVDTATVATACYEKKRINFISELCRLVLLNYVTSVPKPRRPKHKKRWDT